MTNIRLDLYESSMTSALLAIPLHGERVKLTSSGSLHRTEDKLQSRDSDTGLTLQAVGLWSWGFCVRQTDLMGTELWSLANVSST